MSTNNFAFENRCIVVDDDDFTFENVPKHLEYVQGSNRNYPSYYLDKYRHRFHTLDIVITAAYYSGACIDYTPNDKYLDCIYECRNYVSNRDADDIFDDIYADFKAYKPKKRELRKLVRDACNAKLGNYKPFDALFEFLFALEKVEADKILDKIRDDYGYTEVRKIANFCNGEALYEPIKEHQAV